MKQILIASDAFKGTMTSLEVGHTIKSAIWSIDATCNIEVYPVSDGGEGTLDVFTYLNLGSIVEVDVAGPLFNNVKARYVILNNQKTAVIETAQCIGLPMVGHDKHPELATTYGVGQLIEDAIQKGVKHILIGLGGSATNDGGAGMLSALGVQFYHQKEIFTPVGKTLNNIDDIDIGDLYLRTKDVTFTVLSDVSSPLLGKQGASYVYGIQKGADLAMAKQLDQNLKHFTKATSRLLGKHPSHFFGAGAAGGLGYALKTYLKADMTSGIETLLDLMHIDRLMASCDLCITGEGRLDPTSFRGKTVTGILKKAEKAQKKVIVVCGTMTKDKTYFIKKGIFDIIEIYKKKIPHDLEKTASKDLRDAVITYFMTHDLLKEES